MKNGMPVYTMGNLRRKQKMVSLMKSTFDEHILNVLKFKFTLYAGHNKVRPQPTKDADEN